MPKIEEGMKQDIIKDNMLKIIRGTEAITLQAVDSAASVLKAGLSSAEEVGTRAGGMLLDATRRTINAGSIVGSDICEAAKNIVKRTIKDASEIEREIESELKNSVSSKPAGKPEKQAKSE